MPSRIGITVDDVWQVALDGVPTYNLEGERLSDIFIEQMIETAENAVGLDLDVLIGVRTVKCSPLQGDPDDEDDDAVYHPALDKPRNWFAGDRAGIIPLPYRPVIDVQQLVVHPAGFGARRIEIPLDRVRTTGKGFSLVPGPNGYLFPPGTVLANFWSLEDGRRIPGGIEVTYRAGLGKRALKQYPVIKTMVLLQAALLCLSAVNIKLGGGVQQEQVRSDGLDNTVALQKGDLGPLGGGMKAMTATLNAMRTRAQGALSAPSTIWLG